MNSVSNSRKYPCKPTQVLDYSACSRLVSKRKMIPYIIRRESSQIILGARKYLQTAFFLGIMMIGLTSLPVIANTETRHSESNVPNFMVGRWKAITEKGIIEEAWLPSLHGELLGIRRIIETSTQRSESSSNGRNVKMRCRFLTLVSRDQKNVFFLQDTGPRLKSKKKRFTGSIVELSANHMVIEFRKNSKDLKSIRYVKTFDDNLLVIYEHFKSKSEKRWYLINMGHSTNSDSS